MTRVYVYVCMKISEYPPYKCSLYYGSSYTWLNLIYYTYIIFLFTDNTDFVSHGPQIVIFLVFKQSGPNTVTYRKPQTVLNLVAAQIFNCDFDA